MNGAACAESAKTATTDQDSERADAGDSGPKRSERSVASTAADSGRAPDAATSSPPADAGAMDDADRASGRTEDAATPSGDDPAAARGEDAATSSTRDAATPTADDDAPSSAVDAAAPQADASTGPQACAPIDKIDLLLMVDNSNSMAGEQASLKNAFPWLIEALTTGERFLGDPAPFPAIRDLHVGVVSSDMGIPGVELPPSCNADGGDDGRLRHSSLAIDCPSTALPQWLTFSDSTPDSPGGLAKFNTDFRCIAGLGTGGCGFEQQLESPFKALWPKQLRDASGVEIPNPFRFISTTEQGTWGRGDLPAAQGGNLGFLRPATDPSPSLLVVVVVTDEDDCSVKNTGHLRPNNQLPDGDPLRMEDINLRCYLHKEWLYDVKERYHTGFRALRPGTEDRVMFAAIAGVPADLVSGDVLADVDFESADSASRRAFYDAILADERMREVIDPETLPGSGQGNLTTSCARSIPNESSPSSAFPPRRIVELAKLFDQNSTIQSICQDDFTAPTREIVNMIARRLERPCTTP